MKSRWLRYSLRTGMALFLLASLALGAYLVLYPRHLAREIIARWDGQDFRREEQPKYKSIGVVAKKYGLEKSACAFDKDVQELLEIGPSAVYELSEALASENREVQFCAVVALQQFESKAAPAISRLLSLLKSDDLLLKYEVIACLGMIGPGASPALSELREATKDLSFLMVPQLPFKGPDGITIYLAPAQPFLPLSSIAIWSVQKIEGKENPEAPLRLLQ